MSAAPGWYPDPYQAGWSRYFDGLQWTQHTQPIPTVVQQVNHAPQATPHIAGTPNAFAAPAVQHVQQVQVNQVAVAAKPKSVGVAVLLAFLFGPLGMLYSTVAGALVLFAVNLLLMIPTAGIIFLLTWPAGMIWAAAAAGKANDAAIAPVQIQQIPVASPQAMIAPAHYQPAPQAIAPPPPTLTQPLPQLPPSTGSNQQPHNPPAPWQH